VVCEVLLVQRFRFIGVAVLSILVLTIVGAVSLSSAYAAPVTITLNVLPNPALPGQSVTFSGQVTPAAPDNIEIFVESDNPGCADDIRVVWLALNLAPSLTLHTTSIHFTGTANAAGFYSITAAAGFPAGTYGVLALDATSGGPGACDPFTVAPPVPEYPFGLAILAAFMVIAYGVIRRKTVTKQK